MTAEERFAKIEEKLAEITDKLLVAAELRNGGDRRFESERAEVWTAIRTLADQQATTQAALNSLMITIERFIQGRGGNG